jgi:hypothetical protein
VRVGGICLFEKCPCFRGGIFVYVERGGLSYASVSRGATSLMERIMTKAKGSSHSAHLMRSVGWKGDVLWDGRGEVWGLIVLHVSRLSMRGGYHIARASPLWHRKRGSREWPWKFE